MNSELFRLKDNVKLFGIELENNDKNKLREIISELEKALPTDSKISINFFKDGDNFHAEAVIGNGNVCILSRKIGESLFNTCRELHHDVIRKLNSRGMKYRAVQDFCLERSVV